MMRSDLEGVWTIRYYARSELERFDFDHHSTDGLAYWEQCEKFISRLVQDDVDGSFSLEFDSFTNPTKDFYLEPEDIADLGKNWRYWLQAEFGFLRVSGSDYKQVQLSAKRTGITGEVVTTPVYEDQVPIEYILGVKDLSFIQALFYAILSKQNLHEFVFEGYQLEWFVPPSD